MDILVKIPTRARTEQFFSVLNLIVESTSGDHNYHYLISCDNDDEQMNNPEVINRLESYDNLSYYFDERAGKVGSVNRDMDKAPKNYDILMQPSDDSIVVEDDWDKRIVEEMDNFGDGDGVVWFYDGHNQATDTLCIMGRPYYERFNYIYYPGYITLWCDAEFTEAANLLDKLLFIPDVLFEHDHPDWNHSYGYDGQRRGYDQLYTENDNQEHRDADEKLYHERKEINFGLDI